MKKFLLILLLILIFRVSYSFSEEIEIGSEVMSVNPEQEFFIIKAGANKGIRLGYGLIVHRGLVKIAEAYIIEVRENVSAAEVLSISQEGEIQEGDKIIIYREEPKKIYRKEATGEWARLGPKNERVTAGEMSGSTTQAMVYREGVSVKVTIDRDPETVFSYASLILREDGYLITSSNRGIGVLSAYRPISLSLISELWADATAKIDHRLTLSANITGDKNSTNLTMSAFKEHAQKEKHIKIPIAKHSKYYNNLANMVAKIKERSEH